MKGIACSGSTIAIYLTKAEGGVNRWSTSYVMFTPHPSRSGLTLDTLKLDLREAHGSRGNSCSTSPFDALSLTNAMDLGSLPVYMYKTVRKVSYFIFM